jgi:hypothetical protein
LAFVTYIRLEFQILSRRSPTDQELTLQSNHPECLRLSESLRSKARQWLYLQLQQVPEEPPSSTLLGRVFVVADLARE